MNRSDSVANIAPAWVDALTEFGHVTQDTSSDMGTWTHKYASLGAVLDYVRPILGRHGLVISQEVIHGTNVNGATIGVATTVTHTSGEWYSTEGTQHTTGPRSGPQDNGSAITYARRYDLLTFLGLATEDDDGKRAQQRHDETNQPHPNSDRVRIVLDQLRAMTDTNKSEMKAWADGRKLSGHALLTSPDWLELVEAWIDEHVGVETAVES